MNTWHLCWHTFGALPIDNPRGDWEYLRRHIQDVRAAGAQLVLNRELLNSYQPDERALNLSRRQCKTVEDWLRTQDTPSADRVGRVLKVHAVSACPVRVHLVITCEGERLNQASARMKSRTAAIVLFDPGWREPRHVWSKGIWSAQILDDNARDRTVQFVDALRREDAT